MFVASGFVFEECFRLLIEGFDQIWLAGISGWSVAWYCGARVRARHVVFFLFFFFLRLLWVPELMRLLLVCLKDQRRMLGLGGSSSSREGEVVINLLNCWIL